MNVFRNVMTWPGYKEEPQGPTELIAGKPYYVGPVSNGVRNWKKGIDTRIRFSISPLPGDDAFQQWRDAMKSVARLSSGVPDEFRKTIWLSLADKYLADMKLDWEKTKKFAFNEKSNPDDDKLGMQIVKDLHRTGCSGFNGQSNELDRAMLKRVLLAYARWNKNVGYCQGFNVIAALILDVMNRQEDDTLKVMILLIDHVLPESYFANNLKALSVDMAVFRDLLGIHLPQLSKHLDYLQAAARDHTTGANYEPPLTNVFTMQWFLTLFGTSLPKETALRVWDSVLLEGSEILLRTALAIWTTIQDRIMAVQSADEFYTIMGQLTTEMLNNGITDADELIKMIYSQSVFPMLHLADLRDKYTYNITPFSSAMSTGRRPNAKQAGAHIFSDDDEIDEDDLVENINCFAGVFVPNQTKISPSKNKPIGDADSNSSGSSFDISKATPGAWGATPSQTQQRSSAYQERMSLDLHTLQHQYKRLRQRQKQAHIILTNAAAEHKRTQTPLPTPNIVTKRRTSKPTGTVVPPMESPIAVNHLFLGRKNVSIQQKNQQAINSPNIAPLKVRQKSGIVMAATAIPITDNSPQPEHVQHPVEPSTPSHETDVEATNEKTVLEDLAIVSPTEESTPSESPAKDSGCELSMDNSTSTSAVSSESLSVDNDLKLIDLFPDEETEHQDTDSESINCNSVENDEENIKTTSVNNITNVKESDKTNDNISSDETSNNGNVEKNLELDGKQTLLSMAEQQKSLDGESSSEIDAVLLRKINSKDSSKPNPKFNKNILQKNEKNLTSMNNGYNQQPVAVSPGITQNTCNRNKNSSHTKPFPIVPGIPQKKFNPFPRHPVSKSRSETGKKLGLYTEESLAELETVNQQVSKPGGIKNIGRAQINACLHRQYMAGMKQQAKTLRQK